MINRLIVSGLFAIALGLLAVAWSIYDNTQRLARYTFSAPYRIDTLTGGIEICKGNSEQGLCEPWDVVAEIDDLHD